MRSTLRHLARTGLPLLLLACGCSRPPPTVVDAAASRGGGRVVCAVDGQAVMLDDVGAAMGPHLRVLGASAGAAPAGGGSRRRLDDDPHAGASGRGG